MAKNEASLPQDFTSAVNLSLKPGKIMVVTFGLLVGVAAAILFFWLGGMIKPEGLRWLSWIVQRLGAVVFAYVVLSSMCSAVAMAHAESGEQKISVAAAWASIVKNVGQVVLGTLKPIVVFLILLAIIWVAGALGAIPEAGPIIWGIISIIPLAAGVVAALVLAKLLLVSFVFPAVLSVNRDRGIASYKGSVRFIKGHAVHFLGRLGAATLICVAFYAVVIAGFSLTANHSFRTMGNNRVTLRGSPLFNYVAGVPGISGTAPRGFGVENPASSFMEAGRKSPEPPEPDIKAILRRGLTGGSVSRVKASQKVGGWIFSIVFLAFAAIPCSIPLLFFALSGYRTFMSFKDSEELPLAAVVVSLPQKKKTAEEIPDTKPREVPKKASDKGQAKEGKEGEAKPKRPRSRAAKK